MLLYFYRTKNTVMLKQAKTKKRDTKFIRTLQETNFNKKQNTPLIWLLTRALRQECPPPNWYTKQNKNTAVCQIKRGRNLLSVQWGKWKFQRINVKWEIKDINVETRSLEFLDPRKIFKSTTSHFYKLPQLILYLVSLRYCPRKYSI